MDDDSTNTLEAEVAAILTSRDAHHEKVCALRELERDARDRQAAAAEGMAGEPAPLGTIQRALRMLGADPDGDTGKR